ncbi:MAG: amino acid-binding protein [Candidatus Cryptobacteroides sp.]|jgi:hypothetical protein
MTITQLSVFLENKAGTLIEMLETLKQASIQLIAITIAETAEYGICRIICSESDKAYNVLREANVAVTRSKVFALEVENKPGGAAKAISTISKEGIGISYLYSFIVREKCLLIFRTDDAERAADVIRKAKLPTIDDDRLVGFA